MSSSDVGSLIEKYTRHDSQDAETKNITQLPGERYQKQMEVVLAGGEEWVILQRAPPLQQNELTVKRGWLMSVQSIEREAHTAGSPMNEDGLRQGHWLLFFFFQQE